MTISSKPGNMLRKHCLMKLDADERSITMMIRRGGRGFLSKLKQKSIRSNNCWYRVLSMDKRLFIDAVIQTVDRVCSSLLLKVLTGFVEKLLCALGGVRGLMGDVVFGMQSFGCGLARRVGAIAVKWGNDLAAAWSDDEGFIRYLAVIDMNNHPSSEFFLK